MTYITLANMYNSELAELFLQFREKDEILLGWVAEAVLLAFAVQIKLSMSASSLSELGKTCGLRSLPRLGWTIPVWSPGWRVCGGRWSLSMMWYPCRLMRPTHESCAPIRVRLFRLHPRINSAIDDMPLSKQEGDVI